MRVGAAVPEPTARAAHVPVREHIEVAADEFAGRPDVQAFHRLAEFGDEVMGLGKQVPVEDLRRVIPCLGLVPGLLTRRTIGRVGVGGEELPGVPQREHDLADTVADALFGDDEVSAAQDRRGHEEPAHGIRAVAVEDLVDIGVVAQRLRHLLPVGAQHDAVGDAVGECGPVEDRRGQHVQQVEPAAGLSHVFDDEVGWEVVVEPFGVLERVVHLGVAHRSGVEPHVEDLRNALHHRLSGGVVRVRAGQVVDPRTVEVDFAGVVARQSAEVGFDLGQRSVHVGARIGRIG